MRTTLSHAAYTVLNSLTHHFVDENGYHYFTNGFTIYRTHGNVPELDHPGFAPKECPETFLKVFHDPKNEYKYQLADRQPKEADIKGKKKFLFGIGQQLVNATYVRNVWKVLGTKTRFYLSCKPIYPVYVESPNGWEAVILPIRYDPRKPETYKEA